jgi:hypothetical protein
MLANGAPPALREQLWPLFEPYGDGLRMTARFGVFARFTSATSVAIYGVTAAGERRLLSDSAPGGRSLVDARITKIQKKLVHEDMRELLARPYLEYFCRSAARQGLRIERTELELVSARSAAKSEVVLSVACGEQVGAR